MSDEVAAAYAEAMADDMWRERERRKAEGIERLDRVAQDGYWYTLKCGCRVGHIDGQFLHKPAEASKDKQEDV